MLTFTILASLLVLTNSLVVKSKSPKSDFKCDENRSGACLNKFGSNIGIKIQLNSTDQFFDYIHKYLKDNGKDGFTSLVMTQSLFEFCEQDEYADCTSVRGLSDLGFFYTDAVEMAGFFARLAYLAGKGYDAAYQNFDCIFAKFDSPSNQVEAAKCEKTLNDNLQHEPDLACEYFQENMSCITDPYKECGKDAAKVVCNSLLDMFHNLSPRCNDYLSCESY